MPNVYYIVDFESHYVSSEMRRRKITRPTWFKCPAQPSPRAWTLISSHENGLAHLAVWSLMQGWAVRHFIRTNGRFVGPKSGVALSPTEIAMELGLPGKVDLVAETLLRLCEIGWLASEASTSGDIQPPPDTSRQRERLEREESQDSKKNPSLVASTVAGDQAPQSLPTRKADGHTPASDHPRRGASSGRKTQRRGQAKAARKLSRDVAWSPGDGWTGISADVQTRWSEAYELVDVPGELLRMGEWLRGHAGRAKQFKRFDLFATRWFAREQERAAYRSTQKTGGSQARTTALNSAREGSY